MPRVRVSTTVDQTLLDMVRRIKAGVSDSALLEEAFRALLSVNRRAEIDAAYAAAYTAHPLEEEDEWGDLASFQDAADRA